MGNNILPVDATSFYNDDHNNNKSPSQNTIRKKRRFILAIKWFRKAPKLNAVDESLD